MIDYDTQLQSGDPGAGDLVICPECGDETFPLDEFQVPSSPQEGSNPVLTKLDCGHWIVDYWLYYKDQGGWF